MTTVNTGGLAVNTAKTKAVVFRKRGPVGSREHWFYNNEQLEDVNDFIYLGVVFIQVCLYLTTSVLLVMP